MEKKRQIVNIVNFIRGFDSEAQPPLETYYTVKNQIELIGKDDFVIDNIIARDSQFVPKFIELNDNSITLEYLGRKYMIKLNEGQFVSNKEIKSVNGRVYATFELINE